MNGLAIEARGLFKSFEGKPAVRGIDIAVPEGAIYGILGLNGAGKTTTLRMLLGIIEPDRGTRSLLGHERPLEAAKIVGYLPEERGLYPAMTTRDAIAFMGALRGLPLDVGRKRASDLAAGRAISEETVLRMYSYLSRHEVDKQGQGFSPGEDGYPSPGRVAWAAWGGDPGLRWATGIRDQLNAADDRSVMEDDMTTETRALPPSYRPASSEDVPAFTPSCASCSGSSAMPGG